MFSYSVIKKTLIQFAFFIFLTELYSYPIDLTELPAYVRKGFSQEYCKLKPEEIDSSFIVIPPKKHNRKIHISDLDFPDIPKRSFFEFRRLEKQDFTILFFIQPSKEEIAKVVSPAFLFAEIGETWEIYVNNVLIQNKLSNTRSFNQKDVIVNFPSVLLKEGTNHICLHIYGDPLSKETGLYYGKPYILTEILEIYKENTNYLLIFLITTYGIVGILNLIFFIKNTNNKYQFYFSLFSLILAFYVFIRSSLSQKILNIDSTIIFRLELVSLYVLIPLFAKYIEAIVSEHYKFENFIIYISIFHGIFFSITALFFPINSLYDLILIWQLSAPFLILSFVFLIFVLYLKEFIKIRKNKNFLKSIIISFVSTIPGNLLVGVFFVAILSLLDIYLNISKQQSPGLSNYGFLIFLTGVSLRVILNLLDLLNEIETLNTKLKENIGNLKTAYDRLQTSENKYKHLFNQTSEILITINETGNITNLNTSFEKLLGLPIDEYLNKTFYDVIYYETLNKQKNEEFIEKLKISVKSLDFLEIQLPLKFKGDIPFKYCNVFIEKVSTDSTSEVEYLIRATPIKRNPILHYLEKSYTKFILNNDFNHIDTIISFLTEDLSEFFSEMDISMIRIGIREMLINAMEHGNLEISNEEKTKFLQNGSYPQILKERLENPILKNRKVIVESKITKKEVIFKIIDEGNGFDVLEYLNKKNLATLDSLHGRGILITKNAFDKILYNKKGNCVIMIKQVKKNESF